MMPSRTPQLSNKERLLLRKQALKIKRAPVLAVGNPDTLIFLLAVDLFNSIVLAGSCVNFS